MTSTMIEASRDLALVLAKPDRIVPDLGIHRNVPNEVYHNRWEAASNSRLTRIRRSPAHLKAYMDEAPADTKALKIGGALHCAILESDAFTDRFVCAEQCRATKKGDGLRCTNAGIDFIDQGWYCGVHAKGVRGVIDTTRTVISPSEFETCQRVGASIHAHAKAHLLLSGAGEQELSIVWNDVGALDSTLRARYSPTGIRCKAKLDRYSSEIIGGAIVDIKSTKDASKAAFERSIFTYGYHRQGAFYLEGARASGIAAEHFVIIAVEKEAPFAVAVYRLTESALLLGAEQIRPLLTRYADCQAKDEWPAYSPDVEDISVPDWAYKQVDEELREVA